MGLLLLKIKFELPQLHPYKSLSISDFRI